MGEDDIPGACVLVVLLALSVSYLFYRLAFFPGHP